MTRCSVGHDMRPIYNSVDMVDTTAVVIVLVGSHTQPIVECALDYCVYDSCEAGSYMQQFLRMISSERDSDTPFS
jgi:hypothetical protein